MEKEKEVVETKEKQPTSYLFKFANAINEVEYDRSEPVHVIWLKDSNGNKIQVEDVGAMIGLLKGVKTYMDDRSDRVYERNENLYKEV